MANKCSYVNGIFTNNTRSSGNCIIHRWMLISTIGICGVMKGTATLWTDGGAGFAREQMEVGV